MDLIQLFIFSINYKNKMPVFAGGRIRGKEKGLPKKRVNKKAKKENQFDWLTYNFITNYPIDFSLPTKELKRRIRLQRLLATQSDKLFKILNKN